jgi:transcriptional regulator with XRE-family HTH domain
MLDPIIVGKTIQRLREERALSQEVLSGLAGIGRTHLSAIERGERRPTLDTFYRLSVAMNVPASEIMKSIEENIK